jgi:hypothetical protein
MTRKYALEWWGKEISNTEVTIQAIWSIAKFLLKRDGPRTPTAIHGPSGLKFHPSEKSKKLLTTNTMTCVTKTMNGGWRLEFKLCSKP